MDDEDLWQEVRILTLEFQVIGMCLHCTSLTTILITVTQRSVNQYVAHSSPFGDGLVEVNKCSPASTY